MSHECYICGSKYPDAMRLPVEWKMTLVAQEVTDPNYTPDKLSCCMSCNNRMIFQLERLRNKFQPYKVHLSELQMQQAEDEMGDIVPNVPLNDSEDIISG